MARSRGVEARLDRLRMLRQEAAAAEHLTELRAALGDKSSLVVADAAEIVAQRGLTECVPDLLAAFDRFMTEPEADKLCRAKLAIVEALNKLEHEDADVFLRGIRHVQTEPAFGGGDDAAAPLRAASAFGLLRINHRELPTLLADLLADSEKVARLAAAQALGELGSTAVPLLRFKVRVGDQETEVLGECLAALMVAAPKDSLSFVAEYLDDANEALRHAAAFALGESRRPEALDLLQKHSQEVRRPSDQEVILLAISMTRLPGALEFLLEVLAGDIPSAALSAVTALAIHRHNETITARIAEVIAKKGDAKLTERFRKKFEMG